MNRQKLFLKCVLSFACTALLACANSQTGDTGSGTAGTAGGQAGRGGATGNAGTTGTAGSTGAAGSTGVGGAVGTAGQTGTAGTTGGSGTAGRGGTTGAGTAGSTGTAGTTGTAGNGGTAGANGGAGAAGRGGAAGGSTAGAGGRGGAGGAAAGTSGTAGRGGTAGTGTGGGGHAGTVGTAGTSGTAGAGGSASCTVAAGAEVGVFTDPVTASPIAPPNPPGIGFKDTDGNLVNAHGGGIIKVCDTFYMHGEYFLSTTTDNNFNGFSMYSSKNMATWKNEGIILPQQASGQLGPNRKGERPHIIQCPSTGEFVLYAHSADTTYQVDKEVVYATSATVNGQYSFKGSLTNAGGTIAAHSDMSALTDNGVGYVITESGAIYTLAADCHSWTSTRSVGSVVNGTTGGIEAPTVFRAGNTLYWIGSDKTGWRANDDFYSTATSMTGTWTYQGYLAPQGDLTWMTQSTWVMPIVGSAGTTYVYWGDHWYGNQDTTHPGQHNNLATYVFQPLVFSSASTPLISLPTYEVSWKLDVGAGTWTTN